MVTVITANDLSSNKLILVSKKYSSIYKFGLSVWVFVCLFVCLYPINVKKRNAIYFLSLPRKDSNLAGKYYYKTLLLCFKDNEAFLHNILDVNYKY